MLTAITMLCCLASPAPPGLASPAGAHEKQPAAVRADTHQAQACLDTASHPGDDLPAARPE